MNMYYYLVFVKNIHDQNVQLVYVSCVCFMKIAQFRVECETEANSIHLSIDNSMTQKPIILQIT